MDFGVAVQTYAVDYHFDRLRGHEEALNSPDQSTLLTIVQQLHSSLDPRTVFACFGKTLGQYLPLCGIQIQIAGLALNWGKRGGVPLKRHINTEQCLGTVLLYRLDETLTPAQIRLLQTMESMLIQPLLNAISFQQMADQAMFDSLTGLGNRNYYGQAIKQAVARANRYSDPLSLVVLDLDNFKLLNDRHGHPFGDTVLRHFGTLIKQSIRSADQAFRIGGDEFALLLRGGLDSAELLCGRILSQMSECPLLARHGIHTSMGAAEILPAENQDQLYERADKALYQAKAAGRNCYHLSQSLG